MDDLSAPDNPVVIIAILLAMCVAGASVHRNRGHFFPQVNSIVVPSQS